MEAILSRCSEEPMELNYLGIGSCPHGKVLEPKYDQILPSCFHQRIVLDKRPMRLLHFDPQFTNTKEVLDRYFAELNMVPYEFDGGFAYVGECCEAIFVSACLNHNEHFWFFESLVDIVLGTKGKLIVQEYTGYSLEELNQTLYEACPQKELYKRRVLFDMTFGTDLGCCTDMTKVQPFYDYSSNFLNVHFMSDKEIPRWIGVSPRLDAILKQRTKAKFLQTLNQMHVDYRRKLRGEPPLSASELYTEQTSPDKLMELLQESLRKPFAVLMALRLVSPEDQTCLENTFRVYKDKDPYKWYDSVYKLVCSV